MKNPFPPKLSALCNQRLLLGLGLFLVFGIVLFNSLAVAVDSSGWSSGFTHPLHGGDHLLTMLAVGIWAAQLRGSAIWLLPVTFVGVMSVGGLAGAAGVLIPGAEVVILSSCLVFIVLITRKIRFSSRNNLIIVAFFAFFHGFAHGQEISTSASLISYTLGFMVATLLLHGAGILAVRLLVVIFALFISHLAYAQSAATGSTVKLTVSTQTDKIHELILAAHPAASFDSKHYRQLLYSGEDGRGHAATDSRQHHSPDHPLITECGREPARAVHRTSNAMSDKLAIANLPSNHQPGIHFLTSGVGVTSPPVAVVAYDPPRCCPAAVLFAPIPVNDCSSSLATTRYSDLLHIFYTLATSFLTNGVGATSPPVIQTSVVVNPLDFNEFASGYSSLFKSSIALDLMVSRSPISSNSLTPQTRLKSRLTAFAIALLTPIGRQCWPPRFTNLLNFI